MEIKKVLVADKIAAKGIDLLRAQKHFEVDVAIGLSEAEVCELQLTVRCHEHVTRLAWTLKQGQYFCETVILQHCFRRSR